jgi:hypothetical protein
MENESNQIEFGPTTVDQLGKLIGWDAPRYWANNVQVFVNVDHVLFVFREQMSVEGDVLGTDGATSRQPVNVGKSVASIIMPLSVATEFRAVMNKLFPAPAEQENNTP